jgi:hypothetical protein
MPIRILVVLMLIAGWIGRAYAEDGPLDDPPPAAMEDPSLSSSIFFPPSLVTSEAADTGAALDSGKTKISIGASRCSPTNPCAVPSPARDHMTMPRAN